MQFKFSFFFFFFFISSDCLSRIPLTLPSHLQVQGVSRRPELLRAPHFQVQQAPRRVERPLPPLGTIHQPTALAWERHPFAIRSQLLTYNELQNMQQRVDLLHNTLGLVLSSPAYATASFLIDVRNYHERSQRLQQEVGEIIRNMESIDLRVLFEERRDEFRGGNIIRLLDGQGTLLSEVIDNLSLRSLPEIKALKKQINALDRSREKSLFFLWYSPLVVGLMLVGDYLWRGDKSAVKKMKQKVMQLKNKLRAFWCSASQNNKAR